MKKKNEKNRFKLTRADLLKYSEPRLAELRKDEAYLAWWNGLLKSEAFNSVYWKDTEPSGYKSFKEMNAATGKTSAGAFVERDFEKENEPGNDWAIHQPLPVSEFIRLYGAGEINTHAIPIPDILKTPITNKYYLEYFVDPLGGNLRVTPFKLNGEILHHLTRRNRRELQDMDDATYKWMAGITPLEDTNKSTLAKRNSRAGNTLLVGKENLLNRISRSKKLSDLQKIALKALVNYGFRNRTFNETEKGWFSFLIYRYDFGDCDYETLAGATDGLIAAGILEVKDIGDGQEKITLLF